MKYIVEMQVMGETKFTHRLCKFVRMCGGTLGWSFNRDMAHKFSTRKQAEQAVAELHGGTVVEVDA